MRLAANSLGKPVLAAWTSRPAKNLAVCLSATRASESCTKARRAGPRNHPRCNCHVTFHGDPEWSQWSDSEIARRCGVGHDMVASHRPKNSLAENASEKTYTTKHGTTANTGKRP